MALFLFLVLSLTTLLLCYAGYIFLVVDRRAETKMVEDSDLFQAIDDKNYDFELPAEIDEYEELQSGPEPTDKCVLHPVHHLHGISSCWRGERYALPQLQLLGCHAQPAVVPACLLGFPRWRISRALASALRAGATCWCA